MAKVEQIMCFCDCSQFCDGARKKDVRGALFGGFGLPISLRLASQGLPENPHGPPQAAWETPCGAPFCMTFYSPNKRSLRSEWGSYLLLIEVPLYIRISRRRRLA